MKITIFKESGASIPRAKITQLAGRISRSERRKKSEFTQVIISPDPRIRDLNWRFRRKKSATDVLSFPAGPHGEPGALGDVYIASGVARRQAAKCGHSYWDEILILACHGILHLLGYDHHNSPDERSMRAREELLLRPLLTTRAKRAGLIARSQGGGKVK